MNNGSGSLYRSERMVFLALPPTVVPSTTLPPGLGVDPITGAITGVPTVPGSYAFMVAATDATGAITHYPFTLTVAVAAPGPATVAAIPVDAPWALVLASALLGLLGWRQQRRAHCVR